MNNNIDNFTKEELQKAEELTDDLITRAKQGKHSEFIFVRAWPEYLAVKDYLNSAKHVAKQFFIMWKRLMKGYINDLNTNKSTLDLLLTAKNCNEVAEFYFKEADIAKDICKEYHSYVMGGHIIDTIVGNYRPEEELVDYRTLPTKWF